MALSKIDICNQALLKVGADLIASLDTSSASDEGEIRSAKLCNALFDQALDEVLRLYPWNACTKRVQLTRLSSTPTFGYDYEYQLPNDFVRLINIYDSVNMIDEGMQWVLEGNKILCDHSSVYLKYVYRPTDVGILDSLSTKAVICNLAIMLCTPLQLDDNMLVSLTNELYQAILPGARSIDTFESKEFMQEESEWIIGRNYDQPYI